MHWMLLDSNLHIDGDGLNEAHFSQLWQKMYKGSSKREKGMFALLKKFYYSLLLNTSDKYMNWPFKSVKTAYLTDLQ